MDHFRRKALATGNLGLRLATAAVAVPVLLVVIWFGDPWFSMLVWGVAFLGLREFYLLTSGRWPHPLHLWGYLWTGAFLLNSLLAGTDTMALVAGGAAVSTLGLFIGRRRWRQDLAPLAWTLAGAFALGWTLSYFPLLRQGDFGREWVLLALFTVFAADSSAYFVGRALGRHRLAPRISPKKTWEGAAGGVAGALLVSTLIFYAVDLPTDIGRVLGLGALAALASVVGDLSESALKRWAGVKEAGVLVPGHGGLLDRLDSVVLTLVVVYYYVRWIT